MIPDFAKGIQQAMTQPGELQPFLTAAKLDNHA